MAIASGLMPSDAVASLPLPGIGPYGPVFSSMFMPAVADAGLADYALGEPELAVAVDAGDLRPAAVERWRPPTSPSEPLLTYRLPAPVRACPRAQQEGLLQELLQLTDEVAPLAWDGGPPPDDKASLLQRYDLLFRTLVPLALLPHYERLDSRFLSWLESALQRFGRLPSGVPEASVWIEPPRRAAGDPWDVSP